MIYYVVLRFGNNYFIVALFCNFTPGTAMTRWRWYKARQRHLRVLQQLAVAEVEAAVLAKDAVLVEDEQRTLHKSHGMSSQWKGDRRKFQPMCRRPRIDTGGTQGSMLTS